MLVDFIKMHGAGNDFVIIERRNTDYNITQDHIIQICDRNFGVGCDQLIFLHESDIADIKVEFFNPDGSISGACGNGTRCVASLVILDNNSDMATIETGAGILKTYDTAEVLDNGESLFSVNMGEAKFGWQDIHLSHESDTANLDIGYKELQKPFTLSMGNPHAVFFVDDVKKVNLEEYGPILENDPLFTQRANIGVVEVIKKDEINLRVWERGAGETLACGSGACAAVVAGIKRDLLDKNVMVHLPGGDLVIELLKNDDILMTGPVASVFTGQIEL